MKCGGGNSVVRPASFPELVGLNYAGFGVYYSFESISDDPSHNYPLAFRDYLLFLDNVRTTPTDVHSTKPLIARRDHSLPYHATRQSFHGDRLELSSTFGHPCR